MRVEREGAVEPDHVEGLAAPESHHGRFPVEADGEERLHVFRDPGRDGGADALAHDLLRPQPVARRVADLLPGELAEAVHGERERRLLLALAVGHAEGAPEKSQAEDRGPPVGGPRRALARPDLLAPVPLVRALDLPQGLTPPRPRSP